MQRLALAALLVGSLGLAGWGPPPVSAQVASADARPAGVSPGALEAFAAAAPCPTFSWTAVPAAASYELRVYGVDQLGQPESAPGLQAKLPGGALSWTPAADRCLAAGQRYVWSIREVSARGSGLWSEALLFAIAKAPTAADLQRALEVVQRYLGTARVGEQLLGEAAAGILPTRAVAAAEEPRASDEGNETHDIPVGGAPATGVRGEVPDVAGETYGVHGVSNSPDGAGVRADNNDFSGADLVLGGSPPAEVREAALTRESAANLTFDFSNLGPGSMTLTVDGSSVLTAGTDLWVDEAGDTMTGALDLSGNALANAGNVSLGTASTVTKAGARFLFDDAGNESFSAGRAALAANTTGAGNTAVGTAALDANTTGYGNTALGRSTLGANTTAGGNTAVGAYALLLNTGSSNTAVGNGALDANTLGLNNTAVGRGALGANTTAYHNTAVGYRTLGANTTGHFNTALGSDALGSNTIGLSNTAAGYGALYANTTGGNNTALGRNALRFNSTAIGSTAVGAFALDVNTTGLSNTAVGSDALGTNSTGSGNTAVGRSALLANSTAGHNTAVGAYALDANSSGTNNAALGRDALGSNTTGNLNTAVGRSALLLNTASYNTAVGAYALDANTSGIVNAALGGHALGANTTGGYNVALGQSALQDNTTGSNNTAVGNGALLAHTTNDSNTAVGRAALNLNTSGSGNTAVGKDALGLSATGSQNVALGFAAGFNVAGGGSNNIHIGNSGLSADSNVMRLGSVQGKTFVAGIRGVTTDVADAVAVLIDSSGQLGTVSSSARFKEDIVDMGAASERLLALRPVTFRYRPEVQTGERPLEYGLIAEEVAEVFPELVVYDRAGQPETVRYHVLVPLLLNEVQRQQRELQELRREVAGSRRR